ncbi:serine-rich coiled-coil domain-containing protein 2-like isoform X2 [Echeneis naucrates]|uniref:serine-rich coiled-coil domain-containing protein 2-like isoform X2 n=1 Tax=Echeneis naucrates TaxID=173247 RepID=UPI001113A921|nr:serine-rich coiled-coil domain-containing protein 2-like isoform X2 [Echeneis naucrates]
MSAPPLVDHRAMPTMVSRLPKFSSHYKPAVASSSPQTTPNATTFTNAPTASTRLTNGFYHHPGPAGVNGSLTAAPAAAKQNGFIRVPTSTKWRKENGPMEDGGMDAERDWRRGKGGNLDQSRPGSNIHHYCSQRQPTLPVSQGDTRKMIPAAGKGRGFGQMVTLSSPLPESSPRALPVSKSGPFSSKLSQTGSREANGTLTQIGSKPRSAVNGSLRKPQSFTQPFGSRPSSGPGSRSGSPLQKPASRSHSSDNLGSAPSGRLTEIDRFRSRSLTQVRQQLSPTLSSTRSDTINMAADRSLKEPTPRSNSTKAHVTSQTAEGRRGGVKVQSAFVSGRSGVSMPSLLPTSALKKPLLPSLSPASKPSGISYKMSRPSLIKQSRPFRVTSANISTGNQEVNGELTGRRSSVDLEIPSTAENSPENSPDALVTEVLPMEPVSQAEVLIVGETLEDMSLSSTSSLDRNDTSQEYMDDFDNLGNGGVGIMLLSSKNDEEDSGLDQSCARFEEDKVSINGVTKATGLCFLDDGVDWIGVRLTGDRGEQHLTQLSRRRQSSQPDYQDQGGSSLDLSPSDSCGSGGIYMWDEEGLEPLGDTVTSTSINTNGNTTHHIGSFDSDLNSIDILNNLESCDLEDDDLMLDADLAEEASLHSDSADGDGMSHMAQWRRRQLCWGTQDLHNESDFQCYNLTEDPGNKRTDTRDSDLILDLCPSRSLCLSPGSPGLGLDVEELAEDCSAVRSQLEYLQKLLLQEEDVDDDTLTTNTPETSDLSSSSDTQGQVQALLQEVQQLREELRSRDRTIAQLAQQLTDPTVTARCHCQEKTGRTDRHTQTSEAERESVASQTPWSEYTVFPPVPFLSPPWQYQRSRPYRGRPRPSIPSHLARKISDTSLLQPGSPGTTKGPDAAASPSSTSC